jgi:hypothetical protein
LHLQVSDSSVTEAANCYAPICSLVGCINAIVILFSLNFLNLKPFSMLLKFSKQLSCEALMSTRHNRPESHTVIDLDARSHALQFTCVSML